MTQACKNSQNELVSLWGGHWTITSRLSEASPRSPPVLEALREAAQGFLPGSEASARPGSKQWAWTLATNRSVSSGHIPQLERWQGKDKPRYLLTTPASVWCFSRSSWVCSTWGSSPNSPQCVARTMDDHCRRLWCTAGMIKSAAVRKRANEFAMSTYPSFEWFNRF